MDLAIRGALVGMPDACRNVDVLVQDGRSATLAEPGSERADDGYGKVVAP